MGQTFVFDRRLNRVDAIYCFLEKTAHCNVAMCLVAVLERDIGMDSMRVVVQRAVAEVPRLQDRLRRVPGDLAPPVWVRAPTLLPSEHLSETRLGQGATWGDVIRVLDRCQSTSFPAHRPPWSVEYVRGAPAGRAVLIMSIHHALSDATALAALLSSMFMRDAIARAGVRIDALAAPDPGGVAREAVGHWRSLTRGCLSELGAIKAREPQRGRGLRAARDEVREYIQAVPRWPIREHSRVRRSALFRIPLAAWRGAARERGGGVNDLYLVFAAAALRRYLKAATVADPGSGDLLRVVMPVNSRDSASMQDGGNVTGAGILKLAGGSEELIDLTGVRSAARRARNEAIAARPGLVDGALALLPGGVQARAIFRRYARTDLLATNVVVPLACELDGVPVEMVFMAPPVIGPPVSFALAGYADRLHLAVTFDAGLVPAPARFVKAVDRLLGEIVGSSNVERFTRPYPVERSAATSRAGR